jgi:disulfide oxidoreductase YuzD
VPLSKHNIQIVIVDDSKGEKCDAECGVDWSSAESITLASQQIEDRFGEEIKLEYVDLSQPLAHPLALELSQQITNTDLLLPLLLINGQPRISGPFDIRQLLDVIEAETEIEA